MFTLKKYQQRAVDALEAFLTRCRAGATVENAYRQTLADQEIQDAHEYPYRGQGFAQVPYVCIRIPTGGGKTILGSYAVDVAARTYLDNDYPITLWLVPTNTIRLQTVEALKTPGHPYRAQLDAAFKHQVLVLDIDEVTQIRPQDIGGKAIVVVSTLTNLRVTDTSGRKVYAYHENFEPHFAKVPPNHPGLQYCEKVSADDTQQNGLGKAEIGRVKYSFANLLAIYRPLVIVDEAHNARTSLTFETLHRVHPKAIVEFTATPNITKANGSNVLFQVSAAQLKAEEMIKLPVILTEHQNWQNAIRDAVVTRNKLAVDAQKDDHYIRPIALFQAEAKNGEVTVKVLKKHLVEQLHIEEKQIAIATGKQRELDDLNLFDPACPIEYIITIEALKEGWDCPFAYVFCSVKQVSSSKDAEQLLGRVLRMPYTKRRVIEDLNRAYAHLASPKFSRAAQELTDKLIAMGFEEMEVAAFLKQQPPTEGQDDLFGNKGERTPIPPPAITVELPKMPDTSGLSKAEKAQLSMTQDGDTAVVRITGEVSSTLENILTPKKKKDRETFQRNVRIHNQAIQASKAPSERGERFGSLPQVCMLEQGELDLAEPQNFLHAHGWNLLDYPAKLPNFKLEEKTKSFVIDIDKKKLTYGMADQEEVVAFNQSFTDVTEQDLIRWLDHELRQPDVIQAQLIRFISALVNDLLQQYDITLTALVRNKYPLSRAIADVIRLHREKAQEKGYQACLFGNDHNACLSDQFSYEFTPERYPSHPPYYSGRYKFQKHYFPVNVIEDLKSEGEEFRCAQAIDSLDDVKYWIRNLVRRNHASFWLPLAHNKFYPDFVCELTDGRMLVVEYKGEAYESNDDSAEKRAIGNKWADMSKGKCLFIMAVLQDEEGRDVRQQLLKAIERQ